ncbi:hypothetical protein [Paraburkholderia fungorum]|uniref:hypothetical protein n=1 Tax=Paraburkholderia fungorum TaxID=134537 RepID=UPI001C1EAFCA|nr:hypothetical protein [Paraburkholderia fungorum]MBU7436776.1 hypothetical protein [Paraburkholderia fungorum]
MPSIAVRISDSEKIELDLRARGDISKYVRDVLFSEAKCRDESIGWVENRVEDLLENQAVLLATVRALADEVSELKVAPPQQPQLIAAPAATGAPDPERKGIIMELELLRGQTSREVKMLIWETVEGRDLPVWDGDPPPPGSFLAERMAEQRMAEQRRQAASKTPEPPAPKAQTPAGFLDRFRPK